jgi:hypothetical protein
MAACVLPRPLIGEQQAGDVDGEEAAAVHRRGRRSQQYRGKGQRDRLHALLQMRSRPQGQHEQVTPENTRSAPDRELLDKAQRRVYLGGVAAAGDGGGDRNHQGDPGRVVHP